MSRNMHKSNIVLIVQLNVNIQKYHKPTDEQTQSSYRLILCEWTKLYFWELIRILAYSV